MNAGSIDHGTREHLAGLLLDQETVYRDAAAMAETPAVAAELRRLAENRPVLRERLEGQAAQAGAPIAASRSLTGRAHDARVKLRDRLGGGDATAIQEVLYGEDDLLKLIEKALAEPGLSSDAQDDLRRLHVEIGSERDSLHRLLDGIRAS